jgi:sugar/nucleoside kinase (ribokinase family)
MRPTIITIGDVIVDLNIVIPRLPVQANDYQLGSEMFIVPGGTNGNFIIAGQRLGLQVRPLGSVGDDVFGQELIRALKREGVDLGLLYVEKGVATTVAVVLIDDAGEHAFLGFMGAKGPTALPDEWRHAIGDASAVFTAAYAFSEMHPDVILDGIAMANEAHVPFFFDAGPEGPKMPADLLSEILQHTRVFFTTAEEVSAMAGADEYPAAARLFLSQGPQMVVVKRGPAGCHVFARGGDVECPGFPVEVRDTTGAGDSFDAAFVYAFLAGFDIREMGILANAMGAAKVQKLGAGTNVPTADEVRAILERFKVTLPF